MQALIDFDGWKKWKECAENAAEAEGKSPKNKRMITNSKGLGKKSGKGSDENNKQILPGN